VSGDFLTRPLHIEYCYQLHSNLLPNPTRTAPASQVTQQHRNATSFPSFPHSFITTLQRMVCSSVNTSSFVCRLQKCTLNDEVQVVNTISPSYKILSRPIPLSSPTDDAGDTLTRWLNRRHANIYQQHQKYQTGIQLNIQAFLNVITCRLANIHRRFGEAYCLHLQRPAAHEVFVDC